MPVEKKNFFLLINSYNNIIYLCKIINDYLK